MDAPICRTCGDPIPRPADISLERWRARVYCGRACQPSRTTTTTPKGWKRGELLVELDLLVGTDTPVNIANRLGLRPRSIARTMGRAGRPDLARVFEDAA